MDNNNPSVELDKLGELLADLETRRDAYSLWCAGAKGSGVPCEAAASFQRPTGEAAMSLCWADKGHDGAHGDEEGRSW